MNPGVIREKILISRSPMETLLDTEHDAAHSELKENQNFSWDAAFVFNVTTNFKLFIFFRWKVRTASLLWTRILKASYASLEQFPNLTEI